MSSPPAKIDPSRLWEIHGRYYDLEPFFDKHPGGRRLLEQCRGMDCSALFESTHLHDKIPKASLAKFFVAEKPGYVAQYDWEGNGFYPTLKRRVRAHFEAQAKEAGLKGRDARRNLHGTPGFVFRLCVLWSLWLVATYFAIVHANFAAAALWAPMAFALGGYGHEAMHAGIFASQLANRIATFFTIDVMGLSAFVFTGVHVPLHHIDTNVEDKDPDIEVHFPLVREREAQRRFFFHRLQHFYAWILYVITFPLLWFVDFVACLTGIWLGPYGKIRRPFAREWLLLIVSKAISGSVFYVLPFMLHGWKTALVINFLMVGIGGLFVQATFAVSHQNELAMNLDHRVNRHPRDWGSLQMETTVDFQHGHWFPETFFGGLGFQIEHHLFPTVSYSRLREVVPIVRETCKEFGIPYFYYPSAYQAFAAHYKFLRRMGRPVANAMSVSTAETKAA